MQNYGLVERAVRETLYICRDRNIIKKYLEGRDSEVIMLTLFSQEEVWDMQVRSREKEAEKEASIRTMIEAGREFGVSQEDILEKIINKFGLTSSALLE